MFEPNSELMKWVGVAFGLDQSGFRVFRSQFRERHCSFSVSQIAGSAPPGAAEAFYPQPEIPAIRNGPRKPIFCDNCPYSTYRERMRPMRRWRLIAFTA